MKPDSHKFNDDGDGLGSKVLSSTVFRPRFKNRSNKKKHSRRENRKERLKMLKHLKAFDAGKKPVSVPSTKTVDIILTPEQKQIYLKLIKQRKSDVCNTRVKLSLLDEGLNLGNTYANQEISIDDIRSFITYVQQAHHIIGGIPQWVRLQNHRNVDFSVILVVEGVGLEEWKQAENCPTLSHAQVHIPFYSPLAYGGNLISELATIPLTNTQLRDLSYRYCNIKAASHTKKDCQKLLSTMFCIEKNPINIKDEEVQELETKRIIQEDKDNSLKSRETEPVSLWQQDKFPRTKLLLTPWQLVQSNFPMPIEDSPFESYPKIKEKYKTASDQSPMFGLDCEMCLTSKGSELTRISVVNENHEVVYERLVKPYNVIKDYVTRYSGITRKMLENVETRLEQVQGELSRLLPADAILVGQSLEGDLQALKMVHPYVIDTSVIFNMSGDKNRKTGLRMLAQEFLSERVQNRGALGHDSVEDAITAMKLVQAKLMKYFEWGNKLLEGPRDPDESQAAKLLLELRDKMEPEPFVKKYATVCICDELLPSSAQTIHFQRKRVYGKGDKDMRWNIDEERPVLFQATSTIESLTRFHNKLILVAKQPAMVEYTEMTPAELNAVSEVKEMANNPSQRCLVRTIAKRNKHVITEMCKIPHCTLKDRTTIWGHTTICDGNIRRVSKWLRMLKRSFPKDRTVITLILAGNENSKGLCVIDVNSDPIKTNEELVQEAIAASANSNVPVNAETENG